jgi:uncharacterized protein YhaN
MRLSRLDLIRYGKFTDRSVALPARARDFHLIVGPNEAGKSTLRGAILDLLFGFPVRTSLDFLHAKPDLRLAARLEHAGTELDFVRVKATKYSLLSPDGAPLADTALLPFLGQASRPFFDKMFALDHPRLVEGGNSILSAKDDVGQVLFQSAAGVSSLGRVRDALEAEADLLWAPTKSARRAYYIAKADMDAAAEALKAATVGTKKWAEANERVQAADMAVRDLRALLQQKQREQQRLQRIRRVRSAMLELHDCEEGLSALGATPELPSDAAQRISDAEMAQAMAEQRLALRKAEASRIAGLLEGIHVEDTVLSLSEEIEQLEALRHQYGAHAAHIARAQGRVGILWNEAVQAARELGWPSEGPLDSGSVVSESAVQVLQNRLPGLPAMKHMSQLLRERDAIMQALAHAEQSEQSRNADTRALEAKLEGVQVQPVSARMRAALERANALGDPEAALDKLRAQLRIAMSQQQHELSKFGAQAVPVDRLRRVAWPSTQTATRWVAERRVLADELKTAAMRCAEQRAAVEQTQLGIEQFQHLHKTTTYEDVLQARKHRDSAWQSIKSGAIAPAEGGEPLEAGIQRADELADLRHDKAQEAAELQSLTNRLRHETQALAAAEDREHTCHQALGACDAGWLERCRELGLPQMAVDQLPDWLMQKDKALDSARAVEQAEHDLMAARDMHAAIAQELATTLLPVEPSGAADTSGRLDSVAVLRAQVRAVVQEADEARIRRDGWLAQVAEARPALLAAQQSLRAAQDRRDAWQRAWTDVLEQAGLASSMPIVAAEGVLALMSSIAEKLDLLRQTRSETIERMQAELRAYAERIEAIARTAGLLAPAATVSDSQHAFQLGQVLTQRLAAARLAMDQRAQLEAALQAEQVQSRAAEAALDEAKASLKPLFERAGVSSHAALVEAVSRSDQRRRLEERAQLARSKLLQDGDGYSFDQLRAELDAADLSVLPLQAQALEAEIHDMTERLSRAAVELADAQRALDAMAGADAAAQAEARRQEALARMSDAAERYVKVRSAARLLRWSIDRYREQKQGPMLARASAFFAQLTLNSFERLCVDFDKEPMALEGQRADGKLVAIAGLSDGTRDQLYLALRLAALELHLEQAQPLPFIADDLFINYDDARAEAGLKALAELSEQTQVIFLSHHDHLVAAARRVFGDDLNVVMLDREDAVAGSL